MVNNNRLGTIWCRLARAGMHKQYTREKDCEVFLTRAANEGTEFYGRGLHSLRSSLLAALERGHLEIEPKARFALKRGTRLPMFLYDAWHAVFSDNGVLRTDMDIAAVASLNQLLTVFTKQKGGHTSDSESRVLENFRRNDESLPDVDDDYERIMRRTYNLFSQAQDVPATFTENQNVCLMLDRVSTRLAEARTLISYILHGLDPKEIIPKHGSGMSACKTSVSERYNTPRYVDRINKIWPYDEYFFLGASHICDVSPEGSSKPWVETKYLDFMESYEPCARVLLVDKDCRGPRLISCEPRETMFIQQGLMRALVKHLESHPLTHGLVNFTDQSVNQRLAHHGSITRGLMTLDLSDASDMVSWALVKALFPKNWEDALWACRSQFTELPDGTVVALKKHAPMGSAVCFPVMALCLWALLTVETNSIQEVPLPKLAKSRRRHRWAHHVYGEQTRYRWCNPVWVYGDDIVLPTVLHSGQIDYTSGGFQHSRGKLTMTDGETPCSRSCRVGSSASAYPWNKEYVAEYLSYFDLKVNVAKSFDTGFFRESCGKEYYRGVDVTPQRHRMPDQDDMLFRMATIAFHNNLVMANCSQPVWLTELIASWWSDVPEKSIVVHAAVREAPCDTEMLIALGLLPASYAGIDRVDSTINSGVLLVYQPDNSHLISRRRGVPKDARKPFYDRREYRCLVPCPIDKKVNVDRWCQVFRALVNPRFGYPFGTDALAKRVSYKYRWLTLH